jgi:hypothetical protein
MMRLTPAQCAIAAAMPEDQGDDSLEAHLKRLLDDLNLFGYHPYDSRRSARGWVDWAILGPSGALFRELKAQRGVLTVDQRRVGAKLTRAGLDYAVWTPVDLLNGTIAAQLGRIACPRGEAA